MTSRWLSLMLTGALFTPAAWAEEKTEGQAPSGRGARKAARGGDPLTDQTRLTEMLKLDAGQETQLKQLLTEYEQALKDLKNKTPQDIRDRRRDLEQQMREARRNKDKQKAAELAKQMAELAKTDPQAQERIRLRTQLVAEIEKILREDQKQEFRKHFSAKGPLFQNPRHLEEALKTIQLRPDQQANINALFERYRTDRQSVPKDQPKALIELNQKLANDVFNLLDQDQKDQLMKWRPTSRPRQERKRSAEPKP